MTEKEIKELRLLLLMVQLKQSAEKRVGKPLEANGMKKKGVPIHD
jgi:hypothetical protein